MLKLCFKTYNGRLITQRLICVGVEGFGNENRCFGSRVYAKFPNRGSDTFVDGV